MNIIPNLAFIMALIAACIGMLIGIMIFSSVSESIDCKSFQNEAVVEQCKATLDTTWVVVGIIPVALFFTMFTIFGGLFEDVNMPKLRHVLLKRGKMSLKNITIIQKIMLYLGLAKVKKLE